MIEEYLTIRNATEEVLFKEKASKFFGYAFPVATEKDVSNALEEIQSMHPKARHICYAYRIGVDEEIYRTNDAGEPSNSAGIPIYNQIKSLDLHNVLVVVVRYFGGTKLGIPGLVNAYKSTAKEVLEKSNIVNIEREFEASINCNYDQLSDVFHFLNTHSSNIVEQELLEECKIRVRFPLKSKTMVEEHFERKPYSVTFRDK